MASAIVSQMSSESAASLQCPLLYTKCRSSDHFQPQRPRRLVCVRSVGDPFWPVAAQAPLPSLSLCPQFHRHSQAAEMGLKVGLNFSVLNRFTKPDGKFLNLVCM